jgi:hypothetical protein
MGWQAWKAVPGRVHGWNRPDKDKDQDWLVIAIHECCGVQAHTEHVANFSGYLHDAKANAEEACRQHNNEAGQVFELIDAADFLCRTLTEKTLSKLDGNPADINERVWGHVLKRLRLAVAKLATSNPDVR